MARSLSIPTVASLIDYRMVDQQCHGDHDGRKVYYLYGSLQLLEGWQLKKTGMNNQKQEEYK